MEKTNPLVTVNILSYNRRDELRNTLQKVYSQNYKNIEVIVVDNNSTDGSAEMVESEFTSVKLIKLKKNIGIAGWNEGFRVAKGEYVLVLDDDSFPEENAIESGLVEFKMNAELGIFAFNIFNSRINKSETEGFKNPPYFFIGCGALIKKEVLENIGFFNENYFLYYHELDYSARCYNAGYIIIYNEKIKVIHLQSLTGRNNSDPFLSPRRFYFHFVNYSIFLLQNFYMRYALIYLIKWFLNRFIACVKGKFYLTYCKAFFTVLINIKPILLGRRLLKPKVQEFYNFGKMPLIDRDFFPNFEKPSLRFSKIFLKRAL